MNARKIIGYWLVLGCVLIFFQVIIGGATRLTGSGLSITEWKPLVGAIPPLNEAQWNERFAEYQQIVQFKHLNQDMSLSEFKQIFFWEYFHRLWARLMGFAFIIPFAFFIYKKWIDRALAKRLSLILIWGGIVGLYGWIMVKNGLTGLYVPPIYLSLHLILALSLFAYIAWLATDLLYDKNTASFNAPPTNGLKKLAQSIFVLVIVQLILGGIVSGMKAGLAYPTFPTMNGEWIPSALYSLAPTLSGTLHYDPTDFWGRTFFQFIHRGVAYALVILIIIFVGKSFRLAPQNLARNAIGLLPITVLLQATIGVITVINCVGEIPVNLGVLHQAGAMLLLANIVVVNYAIGRKG